MLTLNNTHFVTVETDLNRPTLITLCMSAARFGIHIRVFKASPGEKEHGDTRADFVTIKMRTLLPVLDAHIPPDDFVVFFDANDTVFTKGWDSIRTAIENDYTEGCILAENQQHGGVLKGLEKYSSWRTKLGGLYKHSCAGHAGRWKDLKMFWQEIVFFSDKFLSRTLNEKEMFEKYGLPVEFTRQLNAEPERTIGYDDETICGLLRHTTDKIKKSSLWSSKNSSSGSPLHHWGGRHRTKPFLGGIYGVFPQPPQPLPFPRCQYMQINFPRKKWLEQRPCKGDSALCTYTGMIRGANDCRPVAKTKDKNGEERFTGCTQFVPLKIEPVQASSIFTK